MRHALLHAPRPEPWRLDLSGELITNQITLQTGLLSAVSGYRVFVRLGRTVSVFS